MTEQEIRALVTSVVEQLLAERTRPRRALVLFTGALLGFDDAMDSLGRLKDDGWQLNQVMTESARHVLNPARLDALGLEELTRDLVRDHQLLLIPTLTCNVAAKASQGIADCLASNLVHQFLLQNRPVVAARNGACPDHPDKRAWFPDIPPAFAERLRQNLTDLAGYGVTFCEAAQLDRVAQQVWRERVAPGPDAIPSAGAVHCDRTLISQTVLTPLADDITLQIPAGALVTSLAQDIARAKRIQLIRAPKGI
ncbi:MULTISPECIES: flavoprotein [unclassified Luteococcus]|uniref:flavoprotein n=1 Tax=unclassified Luteococcus TaxID=2639923 RepID=UPI00313D3A08